MCDNPVAGDRASLDQDTARPKSDCSKSNRMAHEQQYKVTSISRSSPLISKGAEVSKEHAQSGGPPGIRGSYLGAVYEAASSRIEAQQA